MESVVRMLTAEEQERMQEYADRWFAAQDVRVLSPEESLELERLLDKVLVGIELGELGFSDVQPG